MMEHGIYLDSEKSEEGHGWQESRDANGPKDLEHRSQWTYVHMDQGSQRG